ncbi:MAG: transcription termination/antitermination protein NusG [Holosporales bacterium]|jgi:transcriptional antiterminator NusG|nr:transcription termination/antitermination protein NusG [Holosporales bacterium]
MEQKAQWYIVQVHSGSENRIVQLIKERAEKKGVLEKFEEILVPTEEVIEIRSGAKVKVDKKYFPGYVLVKVKLDDDIQCLVNGIPRVSGFLGAKGVPTSVSEIEIKRIMKQVQESKESPRNTFTYDVGDRIRVIDGPFASFSGFIEEIEDEKQRLKISVMIFGRATPINLDFTQVEKI